MAKIIKEVKGLYKIIEFKTFRMTPGVTFDLLPIDMFEHIDSIDRVLHKKRAVSPGPVGNIEKPWYMHPYQEDNLVVLHGIRHVDLYTPEHGKVEYFTVTPDSVYLNNELVVRGSVMLVWPKKVFHRIVSGDDGSASINMAVHYDGFDINTNSVFMMLICVRVSIMLYVRGIKTKCKNRVSHNGLCAKMVNPRFYKINY